PGIGMRELASLERISVPGMSKFVARLEEAGLVQRAPVAGDQRRVGLSLSAAGQKVLRSVMSRRTAWLSARLRQLDPDQLEAVVALAGVAQAWHVYVIAALMGLVQVLDAPSRQSLTFRMVGPLELPNAISLNSGVFNGARIFGPALGGVLIAAAGAGVCFAV